MFDDLLGDPMASSAPIAVVDDAMLRVEARLQEFLLLRRAGPSSELPGETYPAQQQREWLRFCDFLGRRKPGLFWPFATPDDIVAYLISKDSTSRTVVHDVLSCPNLGAQGTARPFGPCACPHRAKATSLTTAAAMLRAEFSRSASSARWSPIDQTGNPVHSPLVDDYLSFMEKAQTRAGVNVSQAVPTSPTDLERLVVFLCGRRDDAQLRPMHRLQAAMDATAFVFQFTAGARMGDLLSSLRTACVRLSPLSVGFRQMWGKTVRGFGKQRDFDLPVRDGPCCPVRLLCEYTSLASALGVDLTKRFPTDPPGSSMGFLFRAFALADAPHPADDHVLPSPETYPALNTRFRQYLRDLGLFSGQTLHGLRSTHSLEAELRLIRPSSVAAFVGWASRRLPRHYSRLHAALGPLLPLLEALQTDPADYARRMACDVSSLDSPISPELYATIADDALFVPLVGATEPSVVPASPVPPA